MDGSTQEVSDTTPTLGQGPSVADVFLTVVLVLLAALGLYIVTVVLINDAVTSAVTPSYGPLVWLGAYLILAVGFPILVAVRRRLKRHFTFTKTISLAAAISIVASLLFFPLVAASMAM